MIAVDTSALVAIVLDEAKAPLCRNVLAAEAQVLISAATMARNVGDELAELIDRLGLEVIAATAASARRVAQAYATWGKGIHPAGLNLCDCFAYDVAKEYACPLLFVGDDFSKTDVISAFSHDVTRNT